MTNYMREVANLIGVELEEEFKIKNHWGENLVKLTASKGLMRYEAHRDDWFVVSSNGMNDLLLGNYEIEKLPFKPGYGDCYYTFNADYEVCDYPWMNDFNDHIRMKLGIVYRTKEEAMRERSRIYEELTGKEWCE